MKVAIQGLRGSFHHEAAGRLLPNIIFELIECDSFPEVFAAVDSGEADYGISAIENSLHGSINPVYRQLERYHLWVSGETTLHINQYLISRQPVELETLNTLTTQVLSQAPALAQCELWLDEHLPLAHRQETHDTAASVRDVMLQSSPNYLAIAGKQAAELYDATIVAGPINDDPNNYTRFVLLQKDKQNVPKNANRTSIILKTDHSPGALYRALGVFNDADINLSKLDSHPIPTDKRHYSFYVDFEASLSSPEAQNAIKKLEGLGCKIKVLGSYHTVQ